jgi:hypothetical protein
MERGRYRLALYLSVFYAPLMVYLRSSKISQSSISDSVEADNMPERLLRDSSFHTFIYSDSCAIFIFDQSMVPAAKI